MLCITVFNIHTIDDKQFFITIVIQSIFFLFLLRLNARVAHLNRVQRQVC